ncbi:acyl carrier protein [Longirhabdus pacifica]|uniref:acyl carrier protein n=1 Tax=Longirhabdus pacifica TaxID=2305227 RepID=UPI0013E8E126|nr:acyl carrier protein [Longirhabdus pacifica]
MKSDDSLKINDSWTEHVLVLIEETLSEVMGKHISIALDLDLEKEGIDSIKIVEFILNMEEQLDIAIDDADLKIENFKNIALIVELFRKYKDEA